MRTSEPNTWVVRATDPQLFNCPYVVASDAGTIGLKPAEVQGLRDYLLKGGFLWVDDFWGTAAWEQWSSEIGRVLPPSEFPIKDVPLDDPLLRTPVSGDRDSADHEHPVLARARRGANTSERGVDSDEAAPARDSRSARPHHGADDAQHRRRRFVGARRARIPGFFYQFSPNGYALGVDVLLHAMTH